MKKIFFKALLICLISLAIYSCGTSKYQISKESNETVHVGIWDGVDQSSDTNDNAAGFQSTE